MKIRRLLILSLLVVALLVGGCGLWVWQAKRQYALDRQLIAALTNGNAKQALALVNAGADPNTRLNPTPSPSFKLLLHQLLHRSPPPDDAGHTALTFTCGMYSQMMDDDSKTPQRPPNEFELVQTMLAHGANVNASTHNGVTALEVAAYHCEPRIVELLLNHGANINVQNHEGRTPLIEAASNSSDDMVHFLLTHGAAVNVQNKDGNTALHRAVWGDPDPYMVRQLLMYGADSNCLNKQRETPLTLARQQKDADFKVADIVALLRKCAK